MTVTPRRRSRSTERRGLVLRPVGAAAACCRAAAYIDAAVLAWEREHFFAGALGVRRPARPI